MEADTRTRLEAVFREVFDDDTIVVRPELTADEVEGWDSLAHIRLILTVQKAFGVRFTPRETAQLANVGELAALIEAKRVHARPAA